MDSLPILEISPLFIAEIACKDHDSVDKRSEAEKADREQPEKACTDLADIEAMNAEDTEKPGEQGRCSAAFR